MTKKLNFLVIYLVIYIIYNIYILLLLFFKKIDDIYIYIYKILLLKNNANLELINCK